ncbi:MAG: sulfotransferase domain-containing protein [Pseudomonadales bacterium]|nr:sulfotransferase domain-containing protein [Pseudomonadales bacterium]
MNKNIKNETPRHYQSFVMDSSRWQNLTMRSDDIVICTPPKCGTTWTQMLCALLIFQKAELDKPLSDYSPWLDMLITPVEDVLKQLDAQTHRRFIKTHTPLDGLPYDATITYLCVIRDPRDAFMSMQAHMRNINPEVLVKLTSDNNASPANPQSERPKPSEKAAADEPTIEHIKEPAADPVNEKAEQFKRWITAQDTPHNPDDPTASSVLNYLQNFWEYRNLPNIHFFHYDTLKADLAGEMKRLAKILGIDVAEADWPGLVQAATLQSMKDNADKTAPDAGANIWRDNAGFFNSGLTGQWQDILSDEDLKYYQQVIEQKLPPAAAHWLKHGNPIE